MTRSQKIIGMGLAALVDAAAGSIIAQLCCLAFNRPITLLAIGGGILFALLPDVSHLLLKILAIKGMHHRTLTHYPLLVLPFFLVVAPFSLFWAVLLSSALVAHFADDTTDPGGLKWFAPLWNKRFRIYAKEPEPVSLEVWLQTYYLQPTLKSVGSIVLALVAVSLFVCLLPYVDLLGY